MVDLCGSVATGTATSYIPTGKPTKALDLQISTVRATTGQGVLS